MAIYQGDIDYVVWQFKGKLAELNQFHTNNTTNGIYSKPLEVELTLATMLIKAIDEQKILTEITIVNKEIVGSINTNSFSDSDMYSIISLLNKILNTNISRAWLQ